MNVYFETYGCESNTARSETMKGLLLRSGCEIVGNEEVADLFVVNSCAKGNTQRKIMERIKRLREEYNGKNIILAGCMPVINYQISRELLPEASFVGPNNCKDITKAVRSINKGDTVEFIENKREERLCLPRVRENELIEICEISQTNGGGCYSPKSMEQGAKSYSPENIIDEIKQSLNTGCKEVWLTSHDTASYGNDIGTSLSEITERIIKLPGNFRVKLGRMDVNSLKQNLDSIIDLFKDDKIYSYLNLPLHSGSDDILRKTGRSYRSKDFKKVVGRFRDEIKDLKLKTEVTVGLPGESSEDHRKTKNVLRDVKPEEVDVIRFTETGSKTEDMEVPENMREKRFRDLSELPTTISDQRNGIKGTKKNVLVTEKSREENYWEGHDGSYRRVLIESGENLKGRFVTVRIERVEKDYLVGILSK